jgi:hypothetical protein
MRKPIFTIVTMLLSVIGVYGQHIPKCGDDDNAKTLRAQNPEVYDAAKIAFESQWNEHIKANMAFNKKAKSNPKIIIPVVFHVFHNNGSENLSDAQINAMMVKLNQSYNADPSLIAGVRPIFKDIVADCNFEFRLAQKDPQGNCTNGIVRVQTLLTNKASDDIKTLSTWDTKKYLNIWTAAEVISSRGQAVGGYAQFPTNGKASTDGLLVAAIQSVNSNTIAHEVGHYLGLNHPFEGSETDSCGDGDGVFDTPPTFFRYATGSSNTGRGDFCANSIYNSCASDNPDLPDNMENIMDYFQGACSERMFTLGQYERMKFTFNNYRTQLWQPENLVFTGTNDGYSCTSLPIADFYNSTPGTRVCIGNNVGFRDNSYNANITSRLWNFGEGATPATSTVKDPSAITYSTAGWKTITLTSTSGSIGSNTKTETNAIYVEGPTDFVGQGNGFYNVDWDYSNDFLTQGWYFENEEPAEWKRTSLAQVNGNNSLVLITGGPFNSQLRFGYSYSLISPTYNFSGASNPFISYSYAFAANFLGFEQNDSRDGLQLSVSYDCGKTWSIKKSTRGATGSASAEAVKNPLTTTGASSQSNVYFVPVTSSQWRKESINGNTVGSGAQLNSLKFRLTFIYSGGNNFYLDNLVVGSNGTVGLNELTAKDIQFNIAPNPFNTQATISYQLAEASTVVVKIIDIVGKEIAEMQNGSQSAGEHNLILDKTELNLNSGLYFIKTTVGQSSFTSKILVN